MKRYLIILVFLYCLEIPASAGFVLCQEPPLSSSSAPLLSDENLVHYGDLIDVDVLGGFEFDWRGTLTPDGYLDGMDGYSEPIKALCRSESEIAADVAKVLSRILRDPKIVVRIIDRSNRALVRIDGAVKIPTRFRLNRPVNLRELIVLAGGLTDGASGGISIFRAKNLSCINSTIIAANHVAGAPGDNESRTINISISELLSGIEAANPRILSGDLITVTKAKPVYVIGAVANPKPIYSPSEITVSRAIAFAGGLAKGADESKVTIFRREGNETRVIAVNLRLIKGREFGDEILKPFDIIEVAAKGGGKRRYPPTVAVDENKVRGLNDMPLKVID